MPDPKTVLVIGGAGFIGRRVALQLADRGHHVVPADIATTDFGRSDLKLRRLDLADFEQVLALMAEHRPDVVINLSYMRETTPRAAFRVNILGMDNCFEAARLTGVSHVVYSSSIAVNGRQAPYGRRPVTEIDPPHPVTQYAHHKVFNEFTAEEYRRKHGMSITGLRAAHVAGVDKLIGSVDHVECIVRAARGERVILSHADRMRCVVHVDDIADCFVRLALADKPQHAIYNSGGETLSLAEIAGMVRACLPDADISFEQQTGAEPISTAYMFDMSRLVAEFGIRFPPYQERVAQMIAEVRAAANLPPLPTLQAHADVA